MLRMPDVITRQIQELDNIIESSKKAIQENPTHPHNKAIEFLLGQDYEQKNKLMAELEESLAYYRQHTFKLSFLDDIASMPIDVIGDVLSSFSTFIKSAYFVLNGKERAIPLYLRNTFHGSFGLLMSTNPEENLIEDTDKQLDIVFEALDIIISGEDPKDKIQNVLKHDKKSLSRLRKMFDKISKSGHDVSFEWINTQRVSKKVSVSHDNSIRIYKMLSMSIEEEPKEIFTIGTIVAVDLTDLTIKIEATIQKKPLHVKIMEHHIQKIKSLLGKKAEFLLFEMESFNEITEKVNTRYELIEIKIPTK